MDDSISVSNIPCNLNKPEDVVRADTVRYRKQVELLIDNTDFTDDEVSESSDESENESESDGISISELPEISMQNGDNSDQFERQQTSYAEQSVNLNDGSNSQLSCCESHSDQCLHSFQTQTQGPSEIPSDIEEDHIEENPQTNGRLPVFSDLHTNSRPQETSYVDNNGQESYVDKNGYRSYVDNNERGSYAENGSLNQVEIAELQEKCRSLKVLYESNFEELQQVKNAEETCRKDAEQQKRIFDNKIYLLNDEKEVLFSRLQLSQTLVSNYESQEKNWLSQVHSLENQLADVIEARNEALSKLESSEITVHSLEKQLRELHRSENLSRVLSQHDRISEELKMRHQKEVLQYKERIDELQAHLNLKIQEAERLTEKNSELHDEYNKLKKEKTEQCNDLYTQIEIAQEKYRQYLKNDTVEELNLLKLQVQRLQEENLNMNKQNGALKDDIRSLKSELSDSDTLRRLAFSSKTKHTLQEATDGREKELNLQPELEHSLKNMRTLRLENSDLKKQLKDSENGLAQMVEKIRLYESQISESEKKSKELEEKINYIASNESISVAFHEKKIKSLEQELQMLKINFHDMTKKLKEATSNDKFLRENNEELQKRMGEMIQRHSEEKLKSVEECRLKYLELHENVLSKEREKLGTKSEKELNDLCVMYENNIADLQKEKKALSDTLYETKSQYLAVCQENQNLQMKMDQEYKPKERGGNDIRAEYEKQLQQMKEHFIKQKDEYLDKCLKVEIERAQIDWTNKKMAEIKIFIDNTKQRLDEEFKNCLQKERNSLHQELKLEIGKLEEVYKQKLSDLKQKYDQEKYEQSTQLRQDFQSKWTKELALVKENHTKETKHIKHELENKLFLTEMELKSLKEKLSTSSEAQVEVEKIKQEVIQKQRLFNQEKAQLVSSENELNENLKTLVLTEKRLREKLKKYERHTIAIKKRHEEYVANLQRQLLDLQKTCEEKQNQLHSIRSRYDQQLIELSEKLRKQHNVCRSSGTQTEEEMVPKRVTSDMEAKFFSCLQNISGEFRQYLIHSKNRNAEKQQAALQLYHQQIYSKVFQDLSNDIRSFNPNFIVPRTQNKSSSNSKSKETIDTFTSSQDFHNGQFQTSTPGIFHSSGTRHVQSEMDINKIRIPEKHNSLPNLNRQTKPKSLPKVNFCLNSGTFKDYFSTIYKNVDEMNSGDASKLPKKDSHTNGISGGRDLPSGKDNEAVDGYGDISYDFIPTNLPAGIYDSNMLPNAGLFENGISRKA